MTEELKKTIIGQDVFLYLMTNPSIKQAQTLIDKLEEILRISKNPCFSQLLRR